MERGQLMDKKLQATIKGNVINWGAFSTVYSKNALDSIYYSNDIEAIAERIHNYWMDAVSHLWFLLAEGYEVEGGYTKEKRASHQSMCVPYDELSRDDKLKDAFLIKTLVDEKRWLELGGQPYDYLFEKYNIGW